MKPWLRRALGPALILGLGLCAGCDTVPLAVATPGKPAPGFATAEPVPLPPLDPALLQPPPTPFRLGPGDEVDIELVGDSATIDTAVVGPDGKIYYYLLPGIDVWGLTLPEARDRLTTELKKYLREMPAVSVSLRTMASQRFWILGRVGNPGVYTLTGPTSLLDALSQAGGLSSSAPLASLASSLNVPLPGATGPEAADLTHSFLIRQGHFIAVDFQRLLHQGDLSQNIYLQPDDFIFLPSVRSPQVHVLGAVVRPQAEKLGGALTVVQAIALAGGADSGAYLSNVAILRGSLTHPQIAIVAVDAVLHGKAPDVRLEPNDIVYVPFSPNRVLNRYVDLILDTFVRTVGVNEGAYAITGRNTPVGVGVNLTP
jgi:protein involved in polysaccharide export with SLBB domain